MSNREVVKALYDAFARKDGDALRAVLHPDVEWNQCAGFPGGDRRRGADQVIEKVLGGLNDEWRDFRVDVAEYVDGGSCIVALGEYAGTHSHTGRAMTSVFAHVYDVAEGRVTRFRQFADTHEMVRAMSD